ncbi:Quaternary ammonium compound-resistance protein SugE [Actinomadura rubteroloni]|uniref:Quaternary ammonium compound-resistance protein SugE n=1 Tax=Actinomadura rubteroloni TaxID=1926885 RepID=A0A2P4ULF9_9ACTN|nr:multidrug efflux SMR transporter [Actinomadura rubteroloni]POM25886.1 Quaternary ammonium compound-resistance protein SugE [Actinomadura rubteroloni]
MAWLLVIIAGLFEVAMALSLKASRGFTALGPSLSFLFFSVLSFGLLSLALKRLDIGTAYAVWVGVGAVGTSALGMAVLHDQVSPLKIAALALIVVGVVGLNLAGGGH